MGLIARRARHGPLPAADDISRLEPLSRSRGSASASCRRTGASSPTSPCWRTSRSAASRRAVPGRQPAPSWTPEKLFALFPNLGEMPRPARRQHERRRAADADRRAHADGQPAAGAARRAVGRRRAGDRRADGRDDHRAEERGLSVLLSEQNIHFAELVSDRAYVLEKGQVQWQGRMADLAATSRRSAASCRCSPRYSASIRHPEVLGRRAAPQRSQWPQGSAQQPGRRPSRPSLRSGRGEGDQSRILTALLAEPERII